MDKDLIETSTTDNILTVNFKANALSSAVFDNLNNILSDIESDDTLEGVVFTSTSDKIFLAGADLFELEDVVMSGDDETLRSVIRRGQETYQRIDDLSIPTAAAIHGMCLGGGLELALACDYRLASVDKNTKLGLPEVTLGILPAWGGTTRIIRLLNLPNALKVLLTGGQFATKPSHKMGLIHKMVHRENLVSSAVNMIRSFKTPPPKTSLLHKLLPNKLVLSKARKATLGKTKGNYPAPLKILEVVGKSLDVTLAESMLLEQSAFIELCKTEEMKNLLRIFFLQEKSKKLKVNDKKYDRCTNAVVVGAGTMGAGITQWLSSRGIDVTLKDVNNELVNKGLKTVGDLYVQGVLSHKFDRPTARQNMSRAHATADDVPLDNKDILIEAIVERLDVKQAVLSQLEEKLPDDAIIATNTSALSIDDMASCLKRPDKFIGIHFFNPVHKMKLVEVVRGSKTSDDTVARAVKFVQQIGKLPVIVKDSPGFVVNRVLVPYLVKSAELLDSGFTPESVDKAIVKFGMPMGPFRLMDEIGLDVCYHVAKDLEDRLNIQSTGINQLVSRIGQKNLGKKTGEGFYKYKRGRAIRGKSDDDATSVAHMLINTMVEESRNILKERVIDSSDSLDFAMIMGTGWAPFRGGPLTYSGQHTNTV